MTDNSPEFLKELAQRLTTEEFRITRQKGTERAFTGKYWKCDGREGVYHCKCCAEPLFESGTKYDSGSGWPSFYAAVNSSCVSNVADNSLATSRIEIICSNCDAHLGHVFNDGPEPTGLRYCTNSASLEFKETS